ncbi:MAG: hypothetical protein M3N14_10010 [Bacteroidota bacterium]|nr:hypothetical protein [Bacteroidota bacterium]
MKQLSNGVWQFYLVEMRQGKLFSRFFHFFLAIDCNFKNSFYFYSRQPPIINGYFLNNSFYDALHNPGNVAFHASSRAERCGDAIDGYYFKPYLKN